MRSPARIWNKEEEDKWYTCDKQIESVVTKDAIMSKLPASVEKYRECVLPDKKVLEWVIGCGGGKWRCTMI